MAEIRIGTASWTDPGFVEDWYPKKLPASARLRWYAEHFDMVEVNATFYALPVIKTVERWCDETPSDFIFDVKLPKLLSRHAMRSQFFPPDLRSKLPTKNGVVQLTSESQELVARRLLREIQPLKDAGKLGVFLLQMSPSFRPKNQELSELNSLFELFSEHEVVVELRNRDWVTGEQFQKTLDYFKQRKVTLVLVDAPDSEHFTVMPGFDHVTNPKLGYFRFHGRNAEGYIKGRTVAERFDYEYSPDEVKELAERLRKVSKEVDRLHVIANNNRSNYAPKLAQRLKEQLGLQRKLQEVLEKKQKGQRELF
jgi:uncharacterized protein YecE (DUF72 family)